MRKRAELLAECAEAVRAGMERFKKREAEDEKKRQAQTQREKDLVYR